jgi:hypothetical protein
MKDMKNVNENSEIQPDLVIDNNKKDRLGREKHWFDMLPLIGKLLLVLDKQPPIIKKTAQVMGFILALVGVSMFTAVVAAVASRRTAPREEWERGYASSPTKIGVAKRMLELYTAMSGGGDKSLHEKIATNLGKYQELFRQKKFKDHLEFDDAFGIAIGKKSKPKMCTFFDHHCNNANPNIQRIIYSDYDKKATRHAGNSKLMEHMVSGISSKDLKKCLNNLKFATIDFDSVNLYGMNVLRMAALQGGTSQEGKEYLPLFLQRAKQQIGRENISDKKELFYNIVKQTDRFRRNILHYILGLGDKHSFKYLIKDKLLFDVILELMEQKDIEDKTPMDYLGDSAVTSVLIEESLKDEHRDFAAKSNVVSKEVVMQSRKDTLTNKQLRNDVNFVYRKKYRPCYKLGGQNKPTSGDNGNGGQTANSSPKYVIYENLDGFLSAVDKLNFKFELNPNGELIANKNNFKKLNDYYKSKHAIMLEREQEIEAFMQKKPSGVDVEREFGFHPDKIITIGEILHQVNGRDKNTTEGYTGRSIFETCEARKQELRNIVGCFIKKYNEEKKLTELEDEEVSPEHRNQYPSYANLSCVLFNNNKHSSVNNKSNKVVRDRNDIDVSDNRYKMR